MGTHRALLQSAAARQGWAKLIEVPADGHCLYAAVLCHLVTLGGFLPSPGEPGGAFTWEGSEGSTSLTSIRELRRACADLLAHAKQPQPATGMKGFLLKYMLDESSLHHVWREELTNDKLKAIRTVEYGENYSVAALAILLTSTIHVHDVQHMDGAFKFLHTASFGPTGDSRMRIYLLRDPNYPSYDGRTVEHYFLLCEKDNDDTRVRARTVNAIRQLTHEAQSDACIESMQNTRLAPQKSGDMHANHTLHLPRR